MTELQLTELGDFLPFSPCSTCKTFRNQSFNPFLCLWVICVCWAHSSFTPLSQQGTLSIGGKEVTLEYTPCPEFWRCKRVSMWWELCCASPAGSQGSEAGRSARCLLCGWRSVRVILVSWSSSKHCGFPYLVSDTTYVSECCFGAGSQCFTCRAVSSLCSGSLLTCGEYSVWILSPEKNKMRQWFCWLGWRGLHSGSRVNHSVFTGQVTRAFTSKTTNSTNHPSISCRNLWSGFKCSKCSKEGSMEMSPCPGSS